MLRDLVLLVVWIVLGGACVVSTVALAVSVLRTERDPRPLRWLAALVPPLGFVIALRGGKRAAPVVWLVLLAAYAVARALE